MPCPPPAELARLAQRIEHEFIGLKCGIMDHMVCAVGAPANALLAIRAAAETRLARILFMVSSHNEKYPGPGTGRRSKEP
jgi:hypothetical protein